MSLNAKAHIENETENKIVILHIVESFAGGTFDFLVNITTELSEFKHIIIHGLRKDTPINYKNFFREDITFIFWKNIQREISFTKDLKAFNELLKLLKPLKYINVIHVHSSKAGFIGRLATAILCRKIPVIYTPHGIAFFREDISWLRRFIFIILEFMASHFCKYVICCSKSETYVCKKYMLQNVLTIENGVNELQVKKQEKMTKSFKSIVVTMGRITTAKNPKLFNEIAKKLSGYNNISFLWIGDGENRKELTEKNICITGWLDRNKAIEKLRRCNIYLSTSKWEGLSLSVLAAMSEKKPVVLSRCYGNVDVDKEDNVLFFSNANEAVDSLLKLLDDTNLCKNLGNLNYKVFKEFFTVDKMICKYRKLYLNLSEKL